MSWPFTIRKRTYRLCGFVVVRKEKVVEPLMAEGLEEPFAGTC